MSEVEKLEKQLVGYKEVVDRRNAALRLSENPDFRKIILEEFLVQECARYAHRAGDPAIGKEGREDALNIALAAGHLKRFLSVIVQMGAHAEGEIVNTETAIDEARAEYGDI